MNKINAWLHGIGAFVVAGAMTFASAIIVNHLEECNILERVIAVPQEATGFVFKPCVNVDEHEYLVHISQAGCFTIYFVAGLFVVYVLVPCLHILNGSRSGKSSTTV